VFPIGFILPAQWLAHTLGVDTPRGLVFAGRLVVACLSSVTIVLVARAAGGRGSVTGLIAASLLALNKLQMSFGSSELPRPVAAGVLAGAFLCVAQNATLSRALLAGCLIGIAGSLRFSEITFVVPAAVVLCLQRKWTLAILCTATAAVTFAGLIGVADLWYWGSPLHSVTAAVDYTLVERLSSRGYQSFLWYVTSVPQWISPAVAALAILGVSRRTLPCALWAGLPIVMLSCLPHKEARYLIPITPFAAILAAEGIGRGTDWMRTMPRTKIPIALCVAAGLLGGLQDIGHWRLPRSNADVRFAEQMIDVVPAGAPVSVEQPWRAGGHVYLDRFQLQDLDPARLAPGDDLWTRLATNSWLVLDERTVRARGEIDLISHGYARLPLRVDGSRLQLWRPVGPR
jgi:hypothetical protein